MLWIGIFWFIWAGGCYRAMQWGHFDPVEAKSKAILTANFSLGLLAFWIHWTVAIALFANGFVMYFWAQSFFRSRGS